MIGPHARQELQLMALGIKVCAMVEPWNYDTRWKQLVAARGFKVIEFFCFDTRPHYLVTARGNHWKGEKIKKIYATCRVKHRMDLVDHARIGLLLGYGKSDVSEFLDQYDGRKVA